MAEQDIETLQSRWLQPALKDLSAYHVPPPGEAIKLDAMENPYSWPDELQARWQQRLSSVAVNRYPDAAASALKALLREDMGIANDCGILLGNGSDELIQLLALAVAGSGRCILAPEPGFVMYRMIAAFTASDYCGVALDEDFDLDLPAMLEAIAREQPALIFLAMPNNPTGNVFSAERVQAVIEAAPGLVVLDEAYLAFSDSDCLPLLALHPNVLVMRTLSKVGLAGLRLGMLIASEAWISEFEKLRLPYNIGSLNQAAACFALENRDVLYQQCADIVAERERLTPLLAVLPAVVVFPSEANFILLRVPKGTAKLIHQALLNDGVLIKCLDGGHPSLVDCLRITVGSPSENEAMLTALIKALSAV